MRIREFVLQKTKNEGVEIRIVKRHRERNGDKGIRR